MFDKSIPEHITAHICKYLELKMNLFMIISYDLGGKLKRWINAHFVFMISDLF